MWEVSGVSVSGLVVVVWVLSMLLRRIFVGLDIQHAMRMRHIVNCGLPLSAIYVCPHYLINGTIFGEKKLLDIECVFRIPLHLLCEIYFAHF